MPASQIDAHLARLKEMTRNLGKTPKRDIEDYIIARRATDELCAGALVNLVMVYQIWSVVLPMKMESLMTLCLQ